MAALRSMIRLQGYDLLWIGLRSLWASGAMQLKLNGVSDSMIQKMPNVVLTRGLSARMATPVLCFNVCTRSEN